jgi:hypothetical protein
MLIPRHSIAFNDEMGGKYLLAGLTEEIMSK